MKRIFPHHYIQPLIFSPQWRFFMPYLPLALTLTLPRSLNYLFKKGASQHLMKRFKGAPCLFGCSICAQLFCLQSFSFLILLGLCLCASEAFAMQNDGMKDGLTTLEAVLTGNFTRLIVICGSIWGAYQAYAKSSPMLLGGSVATGLGINFLMTWAKSTWAMLI